MKNITNSGLEQISFKQNSMIYKVNEKPKFAYYIYTGEVEIISKNDYVIGTLKEGELFGEISSLFNKEHSVSAKAATDTRLLIIEKKVFFNKVESVTLLLNISLASISLLFISISTSYNSGELNISELLMLYSGI